MEYIIMLAISRAKLEKTQSLARLNHIYHQNDKSVYLETITVRTTYEYTCEYTRNTTKSLMQCNNKQTHQYYSTVSIYHDANSILVVTIKSSSHDAKQETPSSTAMMMIRRTVRRTNFSPRGS